MRIFTNISDVLAKVRDWATNKPIHPVGVTIGSIVLGVSVGIAISFVGGPITAAAVCGGLLAIGVGGLLVYHGVINHVTSVENAALKNTNNQLTVTNALQTVQLLTAQNRQDVTDIALADNVNTIGKQNDDITKLQAEVLKKNNTSILFNASHVGVSSNPASFHNTGIKQRTNKNASNDPVHQNDLNPGSGA